MSKSAQYHGRLAEVALAALTGRGECALAGSREAALKAIVATLEQGEEEIRQLDQEAQRLFSAHKGKLPPGADPQRALLMIRRRLAEEKGVVL